jgi:hypothetical protein
MRHNDPVTPETYWVVVLRDTLQKWMGLKELYQIPDDDLQTLSEFWQNAKDNPCVAPILDPLGSGPCWGPLTLDHVNRMAGGMKGKRAPSDEYHLVSLCALHHLGHNDKGGRIWATANRPLLRDYLEAIYGEEIH